MKKKQSEMLLPGFDTEIKPSKKEPPTDQELLQRVVSSRLKSAVPSEPDKFMMNCYARLLDLDYKKVLVQIKMIGAKPDDVEKLNKVFLNIRQRYSEALHKLEGMISKTEGYSLSYDYQHYSSYYD